MEYTHDAIMLCQVTVYFESVIATTSDVAQRAISAHAVSARAIFDLFWDEWRIVMKLEIGINGFN